MLRNESVLDRLVSGQAADEGNSLGYAVEAGDVAFGMRNVEVEILESSHSDILNVTTHWSDRLLVPLERWFLDHDGKGFQQTCHDNTSLPGIVGLIHRRQVELAH